MTFIQSITPILNVSNIGTSFEWFEKLGWKRSFSWNSNGMIGSGEFASAANSHGNATFGAVCSGDATLFLCVDSQGSRGTIMPAFPGDDRTDGVWMSWWVADATTVDKLYQLTITEGMITTCEPVDQPWNVREFHLRHPDGHMFRVGAGIDTHATTN